MGFRSVEVGRWISVLDPGQDGLGCSVVQPQRFVEPPRSAQTSVLRRRILRDDASKARHTHIHTCEHRLVTCPTKTTNLEMLIDNWLMM